MDKTNDQFGRPAEILLIEDNEGDIRLTQEVLKDGKVRNRLSVARDGEEAARQSRPGRGRPTASMPSARPPRDSVRSQLERLPREEEAAPQPQPSPAAPSSAVPSPSPWLHAPGCVLQTT